LWWREEGRGKREARQDKEVFRNDARAPKRLKEEKGAWRGV
jgi:hypothetical protein